MNTLPVALISTDLGADRLRIHGVEVHYTNGDVLNLVCKRQADLVFVPIGEDFCDGHQRILQ